MCLYRAVHGSPAAALVGQAAKATKRVVATKVEGVGKGKCGFQVNHIYGLGLRSYRFLQKAMKALSGCWSSMHPLSTHHTRHSCSRK